MQATQSLQDFVSTHSPDVLVWRFLINFFLTALLCFLLSVVYVRFGRSLSNRATFAKNFVVIGMATMLVITIVKSSLALSLGLVGALSIVRFRTAIKEPEELAYLFLTIAMGLGLGADQRLITVAAFAGMVPILWLGHFRRGQVESTNLYFTVSTKGPDRISLQQITEVLQPNCTSLALKRFDESQDLIEACFLVTFSGYAQLEKAKTLLQEKDRSAKVSFVDNEGVI